MKNTRKTLNELAEKFRKLHEDGASMTNLDLFLANIGKEVASCNDKITEDSTEAEITAAQTTVKAALTIYNDEIRMQRLESMDGKPFKESMSKYIADQTVKGLVMKYDKDALTVFTEPDDVELDPMDVIGKLCKPEMHSILDATCIFADNLARMEKKDDGAYVSHRALSASYTDLRNRMGWTIPAKELNNSKLTKQMNDLAHLVFCGLEPKFISADMKWVKGRVVVAKDGGANKNGGWQLKNESTLLKALFRATYTRLNGGCYEIANDTRGDKNALSVKVNKAMAEPKDKKEARPEKTAPDKVIEVETK